MVATAREASTIINQSTWWLDVMMVNLTKEVKFLEIISPTQDSPKDRTNGLIHLCKPTIFTENAKKAAKKRRKNKQWGENVLVRGSLKEIAQL